MKKITLLFALFILAFTNAIAQEEYKIEIFGGIPTARAADITTFSLGISAAYQYEVSDTFATGISIGYYSSFGETVNGVKLDNIQFFPIAATLNLNLSKRLVLGGDIGYAIGVDDRANNGGFYYSPKLQLKLNDNIAIIGAFRGVIITIPEQSAFNIATLGLGFSF